MASDILKIKELNDACVSGDINKVSELVSTEININQHIDKWTPLMHAAYKGNHDILKKLLELKPKVNSKNQVGKTALFLAAEKGHSECVQLLVQTDARLDIGVSRENSIFGEGRVSSPLNVSADNGHLEVVKILIKAGAELDLPGKKDGNTALFVSAKNGHVKVTEELIRAGANKDHKNEYDQNLSSMIELFEQNGQKGLFDHLLNENQNIEIQSNFNIETLYKALFNELKNFNFSNEEKIVQMAIDAGTVSFADEDDLKLGKGPADWKYSQIIKLEAGFDFDAYENFRSVIEDKKKSHPYNKTMLELVERLKQENELKFLSNIDSISIL